MSNHMHDFIFDIANNPNVLWMFNGAEAQPKYKGSQKVEDKDVRENPDTGKSETRYKLTFALSVKKPGEIMPVGAKLPLKVTMWLTEEQEKRYAEMVGSRVVPVGFRVSLYKPNTNDRFVPETLAAALKLDDLRIHSSVQDDSSQSRKQK